MKEAFFLTIIASLGTGLGGLICLLNKNKSLKFLSYSIAFSAGVMLYLSLVEINNEIDILTINNFEKVIVVIPIILSIILINYIEKKLPIKKEDISKLGILTFITILIHNFPEGIATFAATLTDYNLGLKIAFSILIHNIPEGIAIAIPIYYATNSYKKTFLLTLLAGLTEPLGALFSFLILYKFLTKKILVIILSFVIGIMLYISLNQLYRKSFLYDNSNNPTYFMIFGIIFMYLSLIFL